MFFQVTRVHEHEFCVLRRLLQRCVNTMIPCETVVTDSENSWWKWEIYTMIQYHNHYIYSI